MKGFNKMVRTMNKVNAKVKDVGAVGSGSPAKMGKRAKNKLKWRLMNKLLRKI